MRPYGVLQLLGVLAVVGWSNGFVPHTVRVTPKLRRLDAVSARNRNISSKNSGSKSSKAYASSAATRDRRATPSKPPAKATPSLASLIGSWFNLPSQQLSPTRSSGVIAGGQTRGDALRAEISRLRASNAELREEVVALRKSMVDRGYTPVDDIFWTTKPPPPETVAVMPQQQPTTSNSDNSEPPLAKLPPEVRLAALALLYGAAVALGGVFVPIAIGVGAARSLRWLDDGGTLMPKKWRRHFFLGGSRGQPWEARSGRRWRNAVPSYVPALARMPRGEHLGGSGDGDEDGLMNAEALADAWDKMYPPRQ